MVTLAALALGGWAFVSCARDEGSAPSGAVPRVPSAAQPVDVPRVAPSRVRPATDAVAPSGDEPRADDVSVPEDDGFPSVEVQVVRADGTPVSRASVYAVRAGASGRDVLNSGPHADVDRDGFCRLRVPRAGKWDVGAVSGAFQALVRDVALPGVARVRIALPPAGEVVVLATTSAVERLVQDEWNRRLTIALVHREDDAQRALPGRDERLSWTGSAHFSRGSNECRIDLPDLATVRITTTDEFACSPETVVVPATVHVDLSHRYFVDLRARFEPADWVKSAGGWLSVEVDPGAGGSARGAYFVARAAPGVAPSQQDDSMKPRILVGASHGTIRWGGPGVVPGSQDFDGLFPDTPRELQIDVRLDGTPLPEDLPPSPYVRGSKPTRLRIVDPSRSGMVRYFVAHEEGGGMGSQVSLNEVTSIGVLDPAWVVASIGNDIAGPQRIRVEPDAVNELTLSPGGHFTCSPEAQTPPGLGSLTAERADGGMLFDGGLQRRATLQDDRAHPCRIGPMPPGDYELVIRLAGEEVARVTVTVRAGVTTTCTIPRLSNR